MWVRSRSRTDARSPSYRFLVPGLHSLSRTRLFAALTASIAFSLAAVALGFGIAGLAGDTVRVWMKGWERQGYVNDIQQWDEAYSRLLLARRLNPLNADYSADLGRLMEWKAWHQLPDSSENGRVRASAEFFYLEAIGSRPGWGYAWANFAENRLLEGKLDMEFLRALEMATIYAPWEPWVLQKVAWMGMATWEQLPDRMRPIVKESIRRIVVLETFPNDIVRLAVQYNWLDQLTPMLHTKSQLDALDFVLKQLERRW